MLDGNAEDEGSLASTVVDGRSTGLVGCLATGVEEIEFVNGAAVIIGTVSGISNVLVAGTAIGNSAHDTSINLPFQSITTKHYITRGTQILNLNGIKLEPKAVFLLSNNQFQTAAELFYMTGFC